MIRAWLILFALLAACDASWAELTLTIDGLPQEATSVRVTLVGGERRRIDDFKGITKAVYRLPADVTGTLRATAEASQVDGSIIGVGAAETQVPGPSPFSLTLAVNRAACSKSRWCWENPTPQGNLLQDLWGAREEEIWAVGTFGTILRGGDAPWRVVRSGTTEDLNAIWGANGSSIWAVGGGGTILRYNGLQWSIQQNPFKNDLFGVWGSALNDVWAVGAGMILHFDGLAWRSSYSDPKLTLLDVWGSGPDDVWAVGSGGTILHWDGKGWQAQQTMTAGALRAIAGSSSENIWITGDAGLVLQRSAGTWSMVDRPTASSIRWLWVGGATGVFVFTDDGLVLQRQAGKWVPLGTRQNADFVGSVTGAIWGFGPQALWVISASQIQRWDGYRWTTTTGGYSSLLLSVWGSGVDDIWAVGSGVLHRSASGWAEVRAGTSNLFGVWGSAKDDVWAAGDNGTLLHWDGSSWQSVAGPFGSNETLTCIWGSGRRDVWFAGKVLYHYDGSSFARTDIEAKCPFGLSARDVWAPGAPGKMYHFDGVTWRDRPSGTNDQLHSIWGSAATDLWAVGDAGSLVHWDGVAWRAVPSGVGRGLRKIVGTRKDDIWAVGGDFSAESVILHYDGVAWRSESSGTNIPLFGVWASGGEAWAVGYTALLRRLPTR